MRYCQYDKGNQLHKKYLTMVEDRKKKSENKYFQARSFNALQ